MRDEAPEGLYVLNYMYNLHWHAPLRASQPEGFWEKQKIAFPGGDDFIDRDSGSHRGRVAADGAGLEDAANSPDAFDAANLVADGLAILHFELPPFADWRSEMVTRAADQRREARLAYTEAYLCCASEEPESFLKCALDLCERHSVLVIAAGGRRCETSEKRCEKQPFRARE